MATTDNQSSAAKEQRPSNGQQCALLNRDALNLPNLITLSRLGLAVVLFALIDVEGYWITAAVLFVVAASTDALDGFIARRYGMVTALGRVLDPFVDKIIVCGSFVFLLEKKVDFDSGVNAWMVIIVIGREMFVTSLRSFLEQQGQDFSANWIGKLKMATQCLAVTASLLSLSPEVQKSFPDFNTARDVLLWTAVAITFYSGIAYVQRALAMLRTDPKV